MTTIDDNLKARVADRNSCVQASTFCYETRLDLLHSSNLILNYKNYKMRLRERKQPTNDPNLSHSDIHDDEDDYDLDDPSSKMIPTMNSFQIAGLVQKSLEKTTLKRFL